MTLKTSKCPNCGLFMGKDGCKNCKHDNDPCSSCDVKQQNKIQLYRDTELEKYIKKVEDVDITTRLGETASIKKTETKTFKDNEVVSRYDFMSSRIAVSMIVFFLIVNVLSNYLFYSRYVYYSKIDEAVTYVNIVTRTRFIFIIITMFLSMLIVSIVLLYYQSTLTKLSVYIVFFEIAAILSVLLQMFWFAIAMLSGLAVTMLLNFDLANTRTEHKLENTIFNYIADKTTNVANNYQRYKVPVIVTTIAVFVIIVMIIWLTG